ncbi:hypothetical protein ACQ4M3_19025 [Leptolyngbya sp. AN03gr2]|uniref:hypothetical protein n=1 Tax=Leptolyngbya sp. AN03gr2 TaxID=3423364 RepID=UPI003D31B77E
MSTHRFLTLINGVPRLVAAIAASVDLSDANKIIRTNAQGKIDSSLLVYPVSVEQGGTGADNAEQALLNLGITSQNSVRDDQVVDLYEHFLGAVTGGHFGFTNAATNSGSSSSIAGTQLTPGLAQLSTGSTNAAGTASLRTSTNSILFGAATYSLRQVVRIVTLPTATENFSARFGFSSATNATPPNNGINFVADLSSPNWVVRTARNGTATTLDTGVPVSTNWVVLDYEVNKLGTEVRLFIDNNLVATVTTNIPTLVGQEVGIMQGILKSVGTASRTVQVDYVRLRTDFR